MRRCGMALLVVLLAGCVGTNRSKGPSERPGESSASPPPFLAGPAGLLLTNANGFSARVTAEISTLPNEIRTITGVLLGQGSQLVFTPTAGGTFFIWNVKENGGYILNEALQGYAPITSTVHATNVAPDAQIAGPISEKANGHQCKRVDVSISMIEGTAADFTVWRANDLSGFPMRIRAVNGRARFTLNLSDFRREALSPKIFLPPDGFTPYSDAEAMNAELLVRKATLRKKEMPAAATDPMAEPSRRQPRVGQ